MQNFFYILGEALLILAMLGLIGVLIMVVKAALHVKNQTVSHAKRLTQRPVAAVKNLVTTGKGIAQQELVRVKHIGNSVKGAALSVQHSVLEIKEAAQTVHPEQLKPALTTLQETKEHVGEAAKVIRLAAQLSQAASKQQPR